MLISEHFQNFPKLFSSGS